MNTTSTSCSPVRLVEERFLADFPRYPERRLFRVCCVDDPGFVAECTELEHDGFLWRVVRVSAEGGAATPVHAEVARRTFFKPDVSVQQEGNPSTGRVRLLQKVAPFDPQVAEAPVATTIEMRTTS